MFHILFSCLTRAKFALWCAWFSEKWDKYWPSARICSLYAQKRKSTFQNSCSSLFMLSLLANHSLLDIAHKNLTIENEQKSIATKILPPPEFSSPTSSSNNVSGRNLFTLMRLNLFCQLFNDTDLLTSATWYGASLPFAYGASRVIACCSFWASSGSPHSSLERTPARQSIAACCRDGRCRASQIWLTTEFANISPIYFGRSVAIDPSGFQSHGALRAKFASWRSF